MMSALDYAATVAGVGPLFVVTAAIILGATATMFAAAKVFLARPASSRLGTVGLNVKWIITVTDLINMYCFIYKLSIKTECAL